MFDVCVCLRRWKARAILSGVEVMICGVAESILELTFLYRYCEKMTNSLKMVGFGYWKDLGQVGFQLVVRLWKERFVMFLVAKTNGLCLDLSEIGILLEGRVLLVDGARLS